MSATPDDRSSAQRAYEHTQRQVGQRLAARARARARHAESLDHAVEAVGERTRQPQTAVASAGGSIMHSPPREGYCASGRDRLESGGSVA